MYETNNMCSWLETLFKQPPPDDIFITPVCTPVINFQPPILPIYTYPTEQYPDFPHEIILQLVSIAENSSIDWEKQMNYIEDINDGRGYTISIVGFCTGTGDFLKVVEYATMLDSKHPLNEFLPALRSIDNRRNSSEDMSSSHEGLEDLPRTIVQLKGDVVWKKSVFAIVKELYWGPALEFCKRHNLISKFAQYLAYDTILNFGNLKDFENIKNQNETEFLEKFLEIKQAVIIKAGNLGDTKNNRVSMQKDILKTGNLELKLPMSVRCYGDKFNL